MNANLLQPRPRTPEPELTSFLDPPTQSSFKALLAQATKDTTKAQLELSQTLQKRQLAAEEAERSNLQKERQRQSEIEKRRKERFEREKEEQERRRFRPLPKTRNLTELKMERRKRGLNEDGSDDWILNKLEAVKSALPDPPTSKAKIPGQSLKQLMAVASKIPPEAMRTNPKPSTSSSIKAVPTNEQKSAKKRDALFREEDDEGLGSGSMALARQRRFYEERERDRQSSPRASTSTLALGSGSGSKPISAKLTIRANTGSHVSVKSSPRPTNGTSPSSAHGKPLKKGSKHVPGFDPSQFVKLNTEKRDTRTIEEIERDMRLRKLAKGVGVGDKGKSADALGLVEVKATTGATKRKTEGGHPMASSNSNAAKRSKASTSSSTSQKSKSKSRRRRSETPSETETDSDSSQDARHRRQPSKYSSSKGSVPKPKKSGLDDSIRSEIWRLMGRDRSKDLARPFDLSDSEEEGMEVDGEELEREERRAERISRLEEREEEERERRRKEEKERRKRG